MWIESSPKKPPVTARASSQGRPSQAVNRQLQTKPSLTISTVRSEAGAPIVEVYPDCSNTWGCVITCVESDICLTLKSLERWSLRTSFCSACSVTFVSFSKTATIFRSTRFSFPRRSVGVSLRFNIPKLRASFKTPQHDFVKGRILAFVSGRVMQYLIQTLRKYIYALGRQMKLLFLIILPSTFAYGLVMACQTSRAVYPPFALADQSIDRHKNLSRHH